MQLHNPQHPQKTKLLKISNKFKYALIPNYQRKSFKRLKKSSLSLTYTHSYIQLLHILHRYRPFVFTQASIDSY